MGMRGGGRTRGSGRGGGEGACGWVCARERVAAWPRVARLCITARACSGLAHASVALHIRRGVPVSHACPGRLRLQPPSLELPEPPACRCRDARVRSHSCPYLGISGPSNQRGGAGPDPPTPPPRRVPPGLSRSRRRSPLRRRRAMSSSQFNKGPSYGLSAEVKNRVSRAGGGGVPGPTGVCEQRSPGGVPRVPMPSGGCGVGSGARRVPEPRSDRGAL